MDDMTLCINYQEILKLDEMLTEKAIPHKLIRRFDGWQICYPNDVNRVVSVIEHFGSCGKESDLLEIMGLLTPEEEEDDSVVGYLTAENVFNRIICHAALVVLSAAGIN